MRLPLAILGLAIAVTAVCIVVAISVAKVDWPTRTTPLSSVQGWFKAINSHDARQMQAYTDQDSKPIVAANAALESSSFSDLHCLREASDLPVQGGGPTALVRCTLRRTSSQLPPTDWLIDLQHFNSGWLIYAYRQR